MIGTRVLGKQGLVASTFGLGCMGMTEGSMKEPIELGHLVYTALDQGINFLDTADIYGSGVNEALLGRIIRGRRDVVIATKFGVHQDPITGKRSIHGDTAYVMQACEASLKRLGTDHIDLYYQHRVDPIVPIEDTVFAMGELVQQGKVQYLGLSGASPEEIRRAHKVHPITAYQGEYSLLNRDVETEILPVLRELGIGFVAYSPLGRGFMSGKFKQFEDFPQDDFRRKDPRYQGENFNKQLAIAQGVSHFAFNNGMSASQMALAWVLSQGADIVPIPGTTNQKHLAQNIAAAEWRVTYEG